MTEQCLIRVVLDYDEALDAGDEVRGVAGDGRRQAREQRLKQRVREPGVKDVALRLARMGRAHLREGFALAVGPQRLDPPSRRAEIQAAAPHLPVEVVAAHLAR